MAKKKGGGGKADKKGKKGKKDKAEAEEEVKGKKGKKGKKDKKGKGKKDTKEPTVAVAEKAPSIVASTPAAPAPVKDQSDCDETRPRNPCVYLADGGCKGVVTCRPNHYPGILDDPQSMAVVGSECGSYDSLCKLLRAGLRCADRLLVMTPWGNYVIFRCFDGDKKLFFLFDGCTCNVNRFRYLDLTCGTAGLLFFDSLHYVINYMIESREMRISFKKIRRTVIDDICKEFCEFGSN